MSEQLILAPTPQADNSLPRALLAMHKRYGATGGCICRDCAHRVTYNYHGKRYQKCSLTKITHGPGSDWRVARLRGVK